MHKTNTRIGHRSRLAAFLATASTLAICGGASPAVAQTWTGATNNDFTVGSNWSGGAPSAAAAATINTNAPNPTVLGVSGAASATINRLLMGMTVGAGTSELTIQNGSTLITSNVTAAQIGWFGGTDATVRVTGAGSAWSAGTGTINIGGSGSGRLDISSGATVTATGAFTLASSGGGSGTLDIATGGVLATGAATVASTNSTATANVSGVGSRWDVGGLLRIAGTNNATGALNVSGGADVAAVGDIQIGGTVLSGATTSGTVAVSGSGSSLSAGGALTIGRFGAGALTVSNSAVVSADTVTLAGASSASFGNAALSIQSGGVLETRSITGGVGAARQATFNAGTLRATASATAFISGFSGTELNIDAGGLTIDTAGFDVTAASPFTGAGAFTAIGGGTLRLTGANSYTGITTVTGSTLVLQNGGQIVGSLQTNTTGPTSSITVTGAGSLVQTGSSIIGSGTATLNVQAGGVFRTTGGNLAIGGVGTSTTSGTLNLSGAGSLVEVSGGLLVSTVSAGVTGAVNITNGGQIHSATGGMGWTFGPGTGARTVTVSDSGSSWSMTGNLNFANGTISILNGGAVSAASAAMTSNSTHIANLLVSGPGSTYSVSGNQTTGPGTATITLANAGTMSVGGQLTLGNTAFNIGGAEAQAAGAAGALSAATLTFGTGTGRLNFNHTDTNYDFSAAITGSGAINQVAGVTRLTANSAGFTGTTTISGGVLRVNGTLGGATSAVAVNNGGTLGGSGIVGGGVTVANGGVLAPGNSPGTLTINGPLTLNGGSILNMEFGAANAPGDPLNDLIVVNGALTLDGTINVAQSAGGVFGNGLYRIIDYTGSLTDNGLDVGTLPAGSATVQTSIANQVNLVVAGVPSGGGGGGGGGPPPPTFSFWDGDSGTGADGRITGGSGVWTRSGSAWTNASGSTNGAYTQPSFAIFGGTAGTVTVDTGAGPISASGLQFAADGYRLGGGSIALSAPEATIRVGDGTAAGAGFTAVIDSQLTGVTRMVKDDLGTLVLTGANTYAGGTTVAEGALQIGDGGTSGSIQGDVANNATLVFDRSDAMTFAGMISGSGQVRQAGSGALILTADNSYAGGTTVAAGTLQLGEGGSTGSVAGSILNNGVLAIDRSNTLILASTISGSGALRQAGAGTTILTADNTYAGGTAIAAGTLQLGNGGNTGAIVGDVANGGVLAFNRSDAMTFSGLISGAGAVRQMGPGAVTLAAANTYAGGTTILAGTLRGSATSFGTGAIRDDGALIIDQATEATFANAIDGSGSFTKTGAGRLTYSGTGTLSGPTTVETGLLAVNGSLAASSVTVRSGAGLGGAGAVGAVTLDAGSNVAPASGGVLTVNGAFVQAAGSTYQVQIDPAAGAAGRIVVAGAASLAPGAVLNVARTGPGSYRAGQTFTVLSASGGVSGTYTLAGDVGPLSAFLGLKDRYSAYTVDLTVEQVRALAAAGRTSNQVGAAHGADSLAADNPVRTALVNLPTDEAARQAFDQLTGEASVSGQAVLVDQSRAIRDAALDRMADAACGEADTTGADPFCTDISGRAAAWSQVLGGWGKLDGDGNAAQVDQSSAGVLMGLDGPVGGWRLGGYAGYTHTNWDADARKANADSQDYHLGAYGGRSLGALRLQLGAAYSWHNIDAGRTVAFPGLSQTLKASYDANTLQGFADLAYSLPAAGVEWTPFADIAHVRLRIDAFAETGGSAALAAEAETMSQTVTTLGLRPSFPMAFGGARVRFRGMLGWRHAFGDVAPTSTVAFSGSDPFTVRGAALARDAGALDAGLDVALGTRGQASISYGGQYSGQATDHRLRLNVRLRF